MWLYCSREIKLEVTSLSAFSPLSLGTKSTATWSDLTGLDINKDTLILDTHHNTLPHCAAHLHIWEVAGWFLSNSGGARISSRWRVLHIQGNWNWTSAPEFCYLSLFIFQTDYSSLKIIFYLLYDINKHCWHIKYYLVYIVVDAVCYILILLTFVKDELKLFHSNKNYKW